jgi:hypothetical protein
MPEYNDPGSDTGESYESHESHSQRSFSGASIGVGSWDEMRRWVVAELDRESKNIHDLRNQMNKVGIRLSIVEVKVALWAALGGIVGGGIVSIIVIALSSHWK